MIRLDITVGNCIASVCKTAANVALWAARNADSTQNFMRLNSELDGHWIALDRSSFSFLLSWKPEKPSGREVFDFWNYLESEIGNPVTRKAIFIKVDGTDLRVVFEFNGIEVVQEPLTKSADIDALANDLYGQWEQKRKEAYDAYWTPERRAEAERKEKERAKKLRKKEVVVKDALKNFPFQPNDEAKYAESKGKNTDPYGGAIYEYLEGWAALMEEKISKGATLKDMADETSREADIQGITGFMYGCAVSILSEFWIRGEELRRWHNLSTQLGDEGEKANESGGVLNPALLTIGK